MSDLYIEKSKSTPRVKTNDNRLSLEGVALPEDAKRFFAPVFEWVEKFNKEHILMDINLHYFNTSVSKLLLELMRTAENNQEIKKIDVNWHYEDDDPEMRESGEMYEGTLKRTSFHYIELAEI